MATVVITGANRGIGLQLSKLFKDRGDDVVAVCRSGSSDLEALGAEVIDGVDVGDDACVPRLRAALGNRPVDVLINNAGILRGTSLGELDFDSCRQQFEINSLGPLRVTSALLDNLGAGSKIAIITSRMGSIADNTSGGSYGYRMSKAAVNAAGVSLARDLEKREVAVAILHPGWVKTEMTGNSGMVEASESAAGLVARIDALTLEETGSFWHMNGEILPW
jgi:NAD(P)-dependent dehydrogenase (short-subunit alcohol dehydrogenase family)